MSDAPPLGLRRVLVTGGGSGIGRAVAEGIAAIGGKVAIAGRRREVLDDVVAAFGDSVIALECDVTDPAQREALVARAKAALGGLDGFVHSAGAVVHQPPGHIAEADLRAQLEVNLVAPLRLGEQALAELEPGGGMVFVSSTLAQRPIETSAAYSASKAGMLAVMKVLALSGAPRRVRANAVLPGIVDTEMIRGLRLEPGEAEPTGAARAQRLEAQLDLMRRLHPLGRLGRPGDVAAAVCHLLAAEWTTGAELVVDGGLLLRE